MVDPLPRPFHEITSRHLGAQATVCGGRYDGLVEQLGGPATPAVGWALGLERLVLLLAQRQVAPAPPPPPDLYVVSRGPAAEAWALALTRRWRLAGLAVELDLSGAAFGKQFKRADRSGAPWAAVIGDSEAAEGLVVLKDLRGEAGDERRLAPEAVVLAGGGSGTVIENFQQAAQILGKIADTVAQAPLRTPPPV